MPAALTDPYEMYGGELDGRTVRVTVQADVPGRIVYVRIPPVVPRYEFGSYTPAFIALDDHRVYLAPPDPPYAVYKLGEPRIDQCRWIETVT